MKPRGRGARAPEAGRGSDAVHPPARRRPRGIPVAAAVLAACLAGCSDGYPTHDAERIDPQAMTSAQRIAVMNRLGAEAPRGSRWQYRLDADCTLVASPEGRDAPARSVELTRAGVTSAFDRATGRHAVSVVPADATAAPVPVFETLQWTDSAEMRTYVQVLVQACATKAPGRTAP